MKRKKSFWNSKKGEIGFQAIPMVIMGLVVSAAIGVAGFLALESLDDSLVSNVAGCGRNSTGGTSGTILYTSCPEGYNSTQNIAAGLGNVFDFAPTWGTLVGVGILIGIVLLSFGVGAVGYSVAKNKGYL